MRCTIAALLVLGFLAPTAHAKEGWKPLVGKAPPAFHVEKWLNTDGARPSAKALLGKVWMIEFLSVG